jgi:hypothetical protein
VTPQTVAMHSAAVLLCHLAEINIRRSAPDLTKLGKIERRKARGSP